MMISIMEMMSIPFMVRAFGGFWVALCSHLESSGTETLFDDRRRAFMLDSGRAGDRGCAEHRRLWQL